MGHSHIFWAWGLFWAGLIILVVGIIWKVAGPISDYLRRPKNSIF